MLGAVPTPPPTSPRYNASFSTGKILLMALIVLPVVVGNITVYCLTLEHRDGEVSYSNPSRGSGCALQITRGVS
jgi:hypothetical protein